MTHDSLKSFEHQCRDCGQRLACVELTTELDDIVLSEDLRDLPVLDRVRRQALRVIAARLLLRAEIATLRRGLREAIHG
jgi:hypothetical protein